MVKHHNGKLKHAPPKHRTPITASPIHKDAPKKRQVTFCSFTIRGLSGEQPCFPSTEWGQLPSTSSQITVENAVGL
jgi:hypothetical protein